MSLHPDWVETKQICAITNHKNKQSLKDEHACSDILSCLFLSREASVNIPCSSSMAGGKVHVSFAASSKTHSVQPIIRASTGP